MAKRKFFRINYKKGEKKRKNKFFTFLAFFTGGFFIVVFLLFLLFVYYAKDLPRPEKFTERELAQSTKIYDRTGKILLYEIYGEEKRTWVPLEEIPQHLKEAVIVTEDSNFYHHFGIDFKGIVRAILVDLKIKKLSYGASTIPQQLIRSTFLTNKKTISRKAKEIILSLELDRRYPKDQILEWYLNQVPFGRNAYGVEAASRAYFGKPVSEISLPEAATLAALIKAPSYFSSPNHFEELMARKNYVISRLVEEGYLPREKEKEEKEKKIEFVKITQPIKAPHFVFYVKDYLIKKYGEEFLKEKGLRVYTSLDWNLQQIAEKAVEKGAKRNELFHAFNAALVAINPKNGQVLAMMGSKNWFGEPYPENCVPGSSCLFEPGPNVALRERQPGSAFKPFVYVTAFRKGYDDKTIVIDEETDFGVWGGKHYIPQNYDEKFRGPVTLRQALAQSLNVPSVKVLVDMAGIEESIKTAKSFGITTLTKPSSFYGPAIVLGGGEVRLLDMVSAYGVFATEGLKVPPVFILKIEQANGQILEKSEKTPKRVIEKNPCRLINSILSDNEARTPMFGSMSAMYFKNYQVAAKTGTTQDYRDGWIVGYTPSLVAGVWAGNNDNSPMRKAPGITVAGPIWHEFMEKSLSYFPKENFTPPEVK